MAKSAVIVRRSETGFSVLITYSTEGEKL